MSENEVYHVIPPWKFQPLDPRNGTELLTADWYPVGLIAFLRQRKRWQKAAVICNIWINIYIYTYNDTYIYIHIQWYICIYIYIIYIYDWIILNRCWHSWREKHEKNEKNWTNWENTCRDHSAMALLSSLFFRAKFLQSFTNSMSFWWCVAIFALHWCASTKSAKFGMPCR